MITRLTKFILGLILASSLLTGIALADAQSAKAEGELVEKEANEDKLGFTGLKRYDLAIYTLIVFGALIFILGKWAWKPIMAGLDKAKNRCAKIMKRRKKHEPRGKEFLNKVEKQLAAANDQGRAIIEEARKQGQALIEAMKAQGAQEVEAAKDQARREIENAKDQALKQIWDQAVQLASLISAKAVRREISPEIHRQLVEESLSELKQTVDIA